ncbi:MAG: (2Fe-2S)-binding protein [Anaerolineales bacterium]|nr:(2Fe-2S)-binding protein [Anaerolineales bacterium]
MATMITFTINGKERTVTPHPDQKLLDVIREDLGLTGTKRGCDNATCGACTVIINGKATKSCTYALEKIQGAEIRTIESLVDGVDLHPVQEAMVEAGAIQCGYCTPGIVMELVALFETNPDASEKEIMNALAKHLCRCTGYEAIKDAARLAQELVKQAG